MKNFPGGKELSKYFNKHVQLYSGATDVYFLSMSSLWSDVYASSENSVDAALIRIVSSEILLVAYEINIKSTCAEGSLTHLAPPVICSRRQFQIWLFLQK